MTRIFTDENVGRAIAIQLQHAGHDVERAVHILRSRPDQELLRYARETSRVLITFDNDFRDLVFREHLPPPDEGIILVRFQPDSVEELFEVLTTALAHPSLAAHFMTCDREGLRLRPYVEP